MIAVGRSGAGEEPPPGADPLVDLERAVADEARIDRHAGLVHRRPEPVHAGAAAQDVRPARR